MVSLSSLFITGTIDAMEHRCVATVDVPGAFLQTEQDEVVHVRLRDEMARMLCMIDRSKYQPYVVIERKKPVLYARLKKALYGTLRAALQFYNKLVGVLKFESVYKSYTKKLKTVRSLSRTRSENYKEWVSTSETAPRHELNYVDNGKCLVDLSIGASSH